MDNTMDNNSENQANRAPRKRKIRNSALQAASVARSAVGHVQKHHDHSLASTGTNISYEGATAPGSGGSVGTGYASGREAVDEE